MIGKLWQAVAKVLEGAAELRLLVLK